MSDILPGFAKERRRNRRLRTFIAAIFGDRRAQAQHVDDRARSDSVYSIMREGWLAYEHIEHTGLRDRVDPHGMAQKAYEFQKNYTGTPIITTQDIPHG